MPTEPLSFADSIPVDPEQLRPSGSYATTVDIRRGRIAHSLQFLFDAGDPGKNLRMYARRAD